MKLSKKRVCFCVIMFALVLCVSGIAVYLVKVHLYKQTVKQFTCSDIDVKEIEDGIYTGECDVDFIYAKVEVTVKDGAMAEIRLLEHKNDRGMPAEKIVEDMVKEQRIDVDAVSGATNSSKVIKKAVENALTGK